jgi:hypothetical protein
MKDRVDTLGQAVQRGIYSPNEARRIEGLPPVEGGEKPYLQQQMIQVGETPEPVAPPAPPTPAVEQPEDPEAQDNEAEKALIKSILIGKMHHA